MSPTDDQIEDGEVIERVELLLGSLTAVVSARVILDKEKGPQVHIMATSEMPVSEVSRAVMSALTWGLGFQVPSDHITVVQSRLSRDELHDLLGPEAADGLAAAATAAAVEETASDDSEEPKAAVPDTGLVEFSLGGSGDEVPPGTGFEQRRLELHDFQLHKNPQGGFAVSVRLSDNDRTMGAQREAAGTEEDSLEVPANAALGVIEEFLRAGSGDGPNIVLRFLAARRLRHPRHDVVVVVVEAVVRGRRIPMTGAASARDGVERASILATLQATNAFVAGTLTAAAAANGVSAE
jgi:hypothetical protein